MTFCKSPTLHHPKVQQGCPAKLLVSDIPFPTPALAHSAEDGTPRPPRHQRRHLWKEASLMGRKAEVCARTDSCLLANPGVCMTGADPRGDTPWGVHGLPPSAAAAAPLHSNWDGAPHNVHGQPGCHPPFLGSQPGRPALVTEAGMGHPMACLVSCHPLQDAHAGHTPHPSPHESCSRFHTCQRKTWGPLHK